ncbi:MAG: Ig-like domain-containing protein [Eubacteriales bacterium]|nr:Ig-like domain-containing protein [Eubacteriales bacterium]
MKRKSVFLSLLLCVSLCLSMFANMPTYVSAAEKLDYSKYDLGGGTPVHIEANLIQDGVKAAALARIKYWRQDALDTGVKFPEMNSTTTVAQYLAAKGISREAYLNPKWSNEIEYIALARAIEAGATKTISHDRPNGTDTFAITYNGIRSNREVIAWGSRQVDKAIDQWAAEKADWVNQTGQETGHYIYLIDPSIKHYGIAGLVGPKYPYGSTWVGEASVMTLTDESTTALTGARILQVNLRDAMVSGTSKPTIDITKVPLNRTVSPKVVNAAYSDGVFPIEAGIFTFEGTWSSANPAIIEVVDNMLKGVSEGSTQVTLTTANGKAFTYDMTVEGIQAVTNPAPVTTNSGTPPVLPTEVNVKYADNTTGTAPVNWTAFADSLWQNRAGGTFEVLGKVAGYAGDVKVTVNVNPATVSKVVFKGTEVSETNVTTASGTAPTLPVTATVTWSNGDTEDVAIDWPENNGYENAEGGSYTLTRNIHGTALKVTVNVTPATATKVVFEGTEVSETNVTTASGTAPTLPVRATVTWSNGDVDNVLIAWPENNDYKKREGGNYVLTKNVNGTDLKVNVTVTPATVTKVVFTDTEVSEMNVTTASGTAPTLPATATVTWSNGDTSAEEITWPENPDYMKPEGGNYILAANVQGTDLKVNVTVTPATVTKVVFKGTEVSETSVTTASGTAPTLPTTATVTWSNGDTTEEAITWPANEDYKKREGGEYVLTANVQGTALKVNVTVTPATVTKVVFKDTDSATASVTTASGTAPTLPATATVTWSNGDTTEEAITWPANEDYKKREGGHYTLAVDVLGTALQADVTVTPATVTKVVFTGTNVHIADVTTTTGVAPNLPATATVTWSNGDTESATIPWPENNDYTKPAGTTYTLAANVQGTELKANVNVVDATVTKVVFSGTELTVTDVTTAAGTAPTLPEKATVFWSNGTTTEETIVWPENNDYKKREGGKYTLAATVHGMDVTANVTVTPATATKVVFSGTDAAATNVTTPSGTAPNVPVTATVTWSNGDTSDETIFWSYSDDYKKRTGGQYTLTATVAGKSLTADITVEPATVTEVMTNDDVYTVKGTAPVLPTTVQVKWSNGDVSSEAITWDTVSTDAYARKATFTVNGTVTDAKNPTAVTVHVMAPEVKLTDEQGKTIVDGIKPGTKIVVNGTGFMPNETVNVLLHGAVLAAVAADADGNLVLSAVLPADIKAGDHELEVKQGVLSVTAAVKVVANAVIQDPNQGHSGTEQGTQRTHTGRNTNEQSRKKLPATGFGGEAASMTLLVSAMFLLTLRRKQDGR